MGNTISEHTKYEVIKQFLEGHSYKEIEAQTGVSHGAVVNIAEDFRNGDLPPLPVMAELVEALRKVACDLRKHQVSVVQVVSCLAINKRLQSMGVGASQMEEWLDVASAIASEKVSNQQFVATVLEMAELTAEKDLSYEEVLEEYKINLKDNEVLESELQQKQDKLEGLDEEYEKKKAKKKEDLEAITKATATAQKAFAQQTAHLQAQLDDHLAKNKLDWKAVQTATALLSSGLSDAGLNEAQIAELTAQIVEAGSLVVKTKQLGHQADKLEAKLSQMTTQEASCAANVSRLQTKGANLDADVAQKEARSAGLDEEIERKTVDLHEAERAKYFLIVELEANLLLTRFLTNGQGVSDEHFDRLYTLIMRIRNRRRAAAQQDPVPLPHLIQEQLDQYTVQAQVLLGYIQSCLLVDEIPQARHVGMPQSR